MNIYNILLLPNEFEGLPRWLSSKESSWDTGDVGSIPSIGISPGVGNSNPLQYYCLENSVDEEPGGPQSMGLQRVGHDWARTNESECLNYSCFKY